MLVFSLYFSWLYISKAQSHSWKLKPAVSCSIGLAASVVKSGKSQTGHPKEGIRA